MYRCRGCRLGAHCILGVAVMTIMMMMMMSSSRWFNCTNYQQHRDLAEHQQSCDSDSSSKTSTSDNSPQAQDKLYFLPSHKLKHNLGGSIVEEPNKGHGPPSVRGQGPPSDRGQGPPLENLEVYEDTVYSPDRENPNPVNSHQEKTHAGEIPPNKFSGEGNLMHLDLPNNENLDSGNSGIKAADAGRTVSEEKEKTTAQGQGEGEGQGVVGGGINCHINNEYMIDCLQSGEEIYIPFTFINKYFEISGTMVDEGGVSHFDWQHSHAQVYEPSERYSTGGVFMSFEHYNVEIRDRVKCISGDEGVPVSTQWGAQGYFYPIQIAQYGLSHYSKYIIEQKSRRKLVQSSLAEGLERPAIQQHGPALHLQDFNEEGSKLTNQKNDLMNEPIKLNKRKTEDLIDKSVRTNDEQPLVDRNLTDRSVRPVGVEPVMLCDEGRECLGRWQVSEPGRVEISGEGGDGVICFNSPSTSDQGDVTLPLVHPNPDMDSSLDGLPIISFTIRFPVNGSVTIVLEAEVKQPSSLVVSQRVFELHYVTSGAMLRMTSHHAYYGIGDVTTWRTFTRDVSIDLQKAILSKYTKHRRKAPRITLRRVMRLDVRGSGCITNISLSSSAHLAQFFSAADWLMAKQDERGGWPVNVTRRVAEGMQPLAPGWYSAMAQGQAISVLTRAYLLTKQSHYLDSAMRGIKLFNVTSSSGGILTRLADRYPWYEEYPTNPSSFVLNGFIYSLIGLYDLMTVAGERGGEGAGRLYREGVESLKALLPIFDTGAGSVYDLRHFTLIGAAPNVARWDYHATHVNQLLLLATVDDSGDRLFETVARRWLGYMKGKRAPHN